MDENLKKKEKYTGKVVAFVTTMCFFFFLVLGTENSVATYLTTFSVKSDLHATKYRPFWIVTRHSPLVMSKYIYSSKMKKIIL